MDSFCPLGRARGVGNRGTHVMTTPFEVLPGDPSSCVVVHVPHASTHIPASVRDGIALPDAELVAEAERMADVATDRLALEAAERVPCRPWIFMNRLSRLVVDPERFPDERERMNALGMGAVYLATSSQGVLRRPDAQRDAALLDAYFRPYASELQALVAERLDACGRCTIVDLHSYPQHPLPYERPDAPRPPVCLGTDAFHTSDGLLEAVRAPLLEVGEVGLNTPFAGTYVPLGFYGSEGRVTSIMVELRRDVYGRGDAAHPGWETVVRALEGVVRGAGGV